MITKGTPPVGISPTAGRLCRLEKAHTNGPRMDRMVSVE